MASKKLEAAISRLADLFEFGHLQASTNPAAFIGQAADEIISIRARAEKAEAALVRVEAACGDLTSDHYNVVAGGWEDGIETAVNRVREAVKGRGE